jgi:ketosteroid isomerase-like protein
MTAGITAFFESYRAAFDALDARAVAAHFAVPSMLFDEKAYTWGSQDDVIADIERLLTLYRNSGFVSATYEVANSLPQGDAGVTANLYWTITRRSGAPWRFHTGYTLRRLDDQWKIVLCIAYEERSARETTQLTGK